MKVFSVPEKLVIVVIICKINCLERNVQLLQEHVGFYIQVLMIVFGEGEYIADSGLFFLLIQVQVSSRSNKPVVDITFAKYETVKILGFEDLSWLIHRDRSAILK